jgi:hypothetical protein
MSYPVNSMMTNPWPATFMPPQPAANHPALNQPVTPPVSSVSQASAPPAAPQQTAGHLAGNWASPYQWVNSARIMGDTVRDELQKAFPGHYAHLTGWQPIKSMQMNAKETAHVITEVAQHHPVKDHELITFDDNMKRAASLGIATLATLGLKQGVFGVGEFLGMASWFGAMAATPKLINTMVQAKTGINLSQEYASTTEGPREGPHQNMYKDPNYQPFDLLPEAQKAKAAKRLGIPDGPNRRQDVEAKIRQVSVQAHTWGMLVAGFATPVISGLVCDLTQDLGMNGMNKGKQFFHRMEANRLRGSKAVDPEQMADRIRRYLKQITGEAPESELSRWWKDFGRGLVKNTGLSKMDIKLITKGSRIEQRGDLAKRLAELAQPNNDRLEKVKAFLDKQFTQEEENGEDIFSGRIQQIEEKAIGVLDGYKDKLEKKDVTAAQASMQVRLINAKSTIGHYRKIFDRIEAARKANGNAKLGNAAFESLREELTGLLSSASLQKLQNDLMQDRLGKARTRLDHADTFSQIEKNLDNSVRRGETASKLMGATPEVHLLDDALKSFKLGRMWRTRMGLWLGGGILGATALYNFTMVGRDFQSPSQKKPTIPANGGLH